jgi:hypothetical protein
MTLDKIRKHIAATVLAVLLLGTAAGQARAAGPAGPSVPPPAPAATQTIPAESTTTTDETGARAIEYGQRETQSPQAANFRGGAVGLFIGGSTVAVVLLLVLLIILL